MGEPAPSRRLGDADLDIRGPGTSGSVRELLLHIAGGQQTFVLRMTGRQHEGELTRASTWPGFAEVASVMEHSSDQLIALAAELEPDSDADLPFMGKTYRFPRSFFLAHAAAHGVEHRTEVKIGLAHGGIETPDLDGWAYAAEMGYGREV